jgi:hypothetical protein
MDSSVQSNSPCLYPGPICKCSAALTAYYCFMSRVIAEYHNAQTKRPRAKHDNALVPDCTAVMWS